MNMESNSWATATVVVALILVCIVIVIGILGNLMVVLVTIKGNRVRTKGRAFIASLALTDTFVSNKFDLHAGICCQLWQLGLQWHFFSTEWFSYKSLHPRHCDMTIFDI